MPDTRHFHRCYAGFIDAPPLSLMPPARVAHAADAALFECLCALTTPLIDAG